MGKWSIRLHKLQPTSYNYGKKYSYTGLHEKNLRESRKILKTKGLRCLGSRAGGYQGCREKSRNNCLWFVLSQCPYNCLLLVLFSCFNCALFSFFLFFFLLKPFCSYDISFSTFSHLHSFMKKAAFLFVISNSFVIQSADNPHILQVHVPPLQFQLHGKGIQLSALTIPDLTNWAVGW